jgi:hypothetical protein
VSYNGYVLEDYNIKFGLNIDLKEKLTSKRFQKEAKKQFKQIAIEFIDFYEKEFQDLKDKDRTFGQLYNKRNIKVHRKDTPVRGEFSRTVSKKVAVSASPNVIVTRKNRKVEQLTNDQQNRHGEGSFQLEAKDYTNSPEHLRST